jgi:hypothetical protein
MRSFEIKEGPMWELERERRLKDGETEKDCEPTSRNSHDGSVNFSAKGWG